MKQLPENVQTSINNVQDSQGLKFKGGLDEEISASGPLATQVIWPSIFRVCLISYYIYHIVRLFFHRGTRMDPEFGRNNTPQIIQEKWRLLADSFKKVFGGYFKAQFKIMAVIWAILCVGLLFLEVSFAVLVAFLISFLDMLPFFGTGTALIPWAVFKLLSGDTKFAVGLIILYLVTQLVRRVIEPKMVGDSIGMDPLLTLIFMYTGYRVSSVIGMILAVPIGAVVINFYKSGMFDRPLQSAKEAMESLSSGFCRNNGDEEHIENKES